jgi:hypothetical protein
MQPGPRKSNASRHIVVELEPKQEVVAVAGLSHCFDMDSAVNRWAEERDLEVKQGMGLGKGQALWLLVVQYRQVASGRCFVIGSKKLVEPEEVLVVVEP